MNAFLNLFNGHSLFRTHFVADGNVSRQPRLRYEPNLVYQLMCEHQDMLQLFVELKLAAQQRNRALIRRLLTDLYQRYDQHVEREEQKMFPYMSTVAEASKLTDLESVQLSNRVNRVEIKEFCGFWLNGLSSASDVQRFNQALDAVWKLLDQDITTKENRLYPAYNQCANQ